MQIIIWKKEIMISSRGWIIPFCDHVLPIGFILPFPQPTPSPLHNAAVVCNFFAKMPKFWTLTLGNTPMPRHPFLFWYTKKEKYLHDMSIFTFRKKKFPGLPNLGTQIRWATTVQNRPKILFARNSYSGERLKFSKAYNLFGFSTAIKILSSPLEISIKFLRNMVISVSSRGRVVDS